MAAAVAPRTRFDAAFATASPRPGLIPYVTAGFPTLDALPAMLAAVQRGGATAAEVGIPFSDPIADGPTIQRAGWRALRNGMTLRLALQQVSAARGEGVTLPLAVMTYLNPVLAYGVSAFGSDARAAGVDALIVPDLPDSEAAGVRDTVHRAQIALVPLVAPPTTDERIAAICRHAAGFVYCVSVAGVTGARAVVPDESLRLLERVRRRTSLPRALGFGLSRHEHLAAIAGRAEAAVVGSALIDAVERGGGDPAAVAEQFCRTMLGRG